MPSKRCIHITQNAANRLNHSADLPQEERFNFWTGKIPCWEVCHCPAMIREECPATKYQFLPCWQIEGTYCKLDDYNDSGADTTICEVCRVYKKYGKGERIEISLFGRGINNSLQSLEKVAKH